MVENIREIWDELNGYNLSVNNLFYADNVHFTFDFTPAIQNEAYTKAWIHFNFNLNKVIETLYLALKFEENQLEYYFMCDNAIILLITAFESYLTTVYNELRIANGEEEINPIFLRFQISDMLKEKFEEFDIDIAHIDDVLWGKIFADLGHRGLIKVRNNIVHNGWKNITTKSDLINSVFVQHSILIIARFLKTVDDYITTNFPNLNNLAHI